MLFKKGMKKEAVNARLLGENFGAIRNALSEIQGFKEKRYTPTPSHEVRKEVDIEVTWPQCKDEFYAMFDQLISIAKQLDMLTTTLRPNPTFNQAIGTFIVQLNSMVYGLADAVGTGKYALKDLTSVNEQILEIQLIANKLQKHVLFDFKFPGMPGADD